jgi:hypothetical protein
MILRLDPGVPLVWRDTHTLQLGVDRVICVFPEPTGRTENLLTALRAGSPRSALIVTACDGQRRERATAEVDALLDLVADALLPDTAGEDTSRPIVVVDGAGSTARHLSAVLHDAGYDVAAPGSSDDRVVAAAIIIGDRVLPPWRHGPWLRRDVPHLPIVFGDDGATLGPFVDLDGPCLRCVALARTDEDPAWPAICMQLDALPPLAEPAMLSAQVVALAARWLDARVRDGERTRAATSIRVHPDGSISERLHAPHPRCGCRALPENVTSLAARPPVRPSSARAGAAHG